MCRLAITVAKVATNDTEPGLVDVNGSLRAYFDEFGIDAFLMRPDYYVYGVVPTGGRIADLIDQVGLHIPPMVSASEMTTAVSNR
jgi:hypothetical protein